MFGKRWEQRSQNWEKQQISSHQGASIPKLGIIKKTRRKEWSTLGTGKREVQHSTDRRKGLGFHTAGDQDAIERHSPSKSEELRGDCRIRSGDRRYSRRGAKDRTLYRGGVSPRFGEGGGKLKSYNMGFVTVSTVKSKKKWIGLWGGFIRCNGIIRNKPPHSKYPRLREIPRLTVATTFKVERVLYR